MIVKNYGKGVNGVGYLVRVVNITPNIYVRKVERSKLNLTELTFGSLYPRCASPIVRRKTTLSLVSADDLKLTPQNPHRKFNLPM